MKTGMINLTEEEKLLNAECELLKRDFADLFAKKNDMLSFEESLLTALYLKNIGKKQYQLYCLGGEISKIKHRIDLIQQCLNRNEYPDKKLIDLEIKTTFAEYQHKIEAEAVRLEAAVIFLRSEFLTEEETKKIRETYRLIVKNLHPDINPNLSEHEKELFIKAQSAYEMNDLNSLNDILLSIHPDEPKETGLTPVQMKEFVAQLHDHIRRLKKQIEDLNKRFPFSIREQLFDSEWIAAEQHKLDEKILILQKEKARKNEHLILLGLWKPESLN